MAQDNAKKIKEDLEKRNRDIVQDVSEKRNFLFSPIHYKKSLISYISML